MLTMKMWHHIMRLMFLMTSWPMLAGASVYDPNLDDYGIDNSQSYSYDLAKPVIESGGDVNAQHGDLLRTAVNLKHIGVVKYLLDYGANPNGTNDPSAGYLVGGPLRYASSLGDLEIVKILLNAGADVNIAEGKPLSNAAAEGNIEMVKYLLGVGANPDGTNETSTERGGPLKSAADNNHLDVINVLLGAGASVNISKGGAAILKGAAVRGHLAVIQRLLEAGVHPNENDGLTLLFAAERGQVDVVKAFIKFGVDVNLESGGAIKAAARRGSVELVKVLMEAGADNPSVVRAMNYAADHGKLNVVRSMLELGAIITYDADWSLMHDAVLYNHREVFTLMVEYGADINRPSTIDRYVDPGFSSVKLGNGWTPLHVAARFGKPLIHLLVELGADVSLQDARGFTPLQIALKYWHLKVAKELLLYCADVNPINEEGNTAYDIALNVSSMYMSQSNVTRDIINAFSADMLGKIDSSYYNSDNIKALEAEFQAIFDEDFTLQDQLKGYDHIFRAEVHIAIGYLLRQRAKNDSTKVIEDHKCIADLAVATEYIAKCECIPGQGPTMTFTPIQNGKPCDPLMPIQEELPPTLPGNGTVDEVKAVETEGGQTTI